MNNFGNKIQENVDNYKKKLIKKHPNLKSDDSSDNDSDDPDSWIGAIVVAVFIIMLGFMVFQIFARGSGATTSLKSIFLIIDEFL